MQRSVSEERNRFSQSSSCQRSGEWRQASCSLRRFVSLSGRALRAVWQANPSDAAVSRFPPSAPPLGLVVDGKAVARFIGVHRRSAGVHQHRFNDDGARVHQPASSRPAPGHLSRLFRRLRRHPAFLAPSSSCLPTHSPTTNLIAQFAQARVRPRGSHSDDAQDATLHRRPASGLVYGMKLPHLPNMVARTSLI